jgi:transposase
MELFLEKSQLSLLQNLQRSTSDRATYQKLTILLMIHQKYPFSEIAFILGIDNTTVYRYFHQYESCNDLTTYLSSHYKPYVGKLTPEQSQEVKAYVGSSICHSSHQVQRFIKEKFDITYHQDSVIALLHRLGFVYKKTKLVPSQGDSKKQEAFIESFREVEQSLTSDEVILFGDGVHPHHNTESTYAWIAKGQEKEILSNTARVRVNLNGAINPANPTQIVTHSCETINAESTITWLQLIEERFSQLKTIYLYVDNARYYRSKLVSQYLENSKIKMIFLPPYSPNLNPIERLWKFLKKEVIKSNYTPNSTIFRQRINDFFDNIQQYKEQLDSLINTKFQKLKSHQRDLQTSMR